MKTDDPDHQLSSLRASFQVSASGAPLLRSVLFVTFFSIERSTFLNSYIIMELDLFLSRVESVYAILLMDFLPVISLFVNVLSDLVIVIEQV